MAEPDYLVVRNHQEQYSIWIADRELPAGWEAVGSSGTREACLDHIEQVWTDMRPRSVRLRDEQRATSA
jgi:MbtH protein